MIQTKLRKLVYYSLIFIVFCFILSCSNERKKTVGTKFFKISTWNTETKLIESNQFQGKIVLLKNLDTISYKFGYVVNTLTERDPEVIFTPSFKDTVQFNTKGYLFSDDPIFDMDRYRKQNVRFERINGYRAKITYPRVEETNGFWGVYFDSIRVDGFGKLRFVLHGNMKKSDVNEWLRITSSIVFDSANIKQQKNFYQY